MCNFHTICVLSAVLLINRIGAENDFVEIVSQKAIDLTEFVDLDDTNYVRFKSYMDNGYTSKDITFNIYDINIQNATVALYRLLQDITVEDYNSIKHWINENLNSDMVLYVWHLLTLYNKNFSQEDHRPPFITKPNYYFLGETLFKAFQMKTAKNQTVQTPIEANYSGWNVPSKGCNEVIKYFTEDIGLNSYYYGLHMLHPFWMSNEEQEKINPKYAEHYYFSHQQLLARYHLEKQHVEVQSRCNVFNPYLVYKNGLPFPIRGKIEDSNTLRLVLETGIAIREILSRNFVLSGNGKKENLNENNHISLISKFVRDKLDGTVTATSTRNLYGYGGCEYWKDKYNPAPSVMHNPETSLRDPYYWTLMQSTLDYVLEYQNSLEPYDLSDYETEDFDILNMETTKIYTYFDYYQTSLEQIFGSCTGHCTDHNSITVRQKRLNHHPVTLYFQVKSRVQSDAIVRLFLGPLCSSDICLKNNTKFLKLDAFKVSLKEGINMINWSSLASNRLSKDTLFNLERPTKQSNTNEYNLFKFPQNLLIPQGLKEGMPLTLFIMITPTDDNSNKSMNLNSKYYGDIIAEIDSKPLGFPFHRKVAMTKYAASNFRFFNVTIYHENIEPTNSLTMS